MMAGLVAFTVTTLTFIYLVAFIENTPDFVNRYGRPGIKPLVEKLGLKMPEGPRSIFYRNILAKAVSVSEISIVQMAIIYGVFFLGLKLLLSWFGNISRGGGSLCVVGVRSFMSAAMIILPALGILSTVIGILSVGNVSRETVKLIIFGPSGIGILGYLVATAFSGLSDYLGER